MEVAPSYDHESSRVAVPFSPCYGVVGDSTSVYKCEEFELTDYSAAMKVQKFYRGYRTRRLLADSAVVAEELWWQAIDYARLNHSTISFFNFSKPETVSSRWTRVTLNASKVGKGLSKDAKAQKLAFQHWIEAIDPRHRYGHSLHLYYEEWCKAEAGQPFFYWLDIGDGKEVDLPKCPRSKLRQQCIKYLGPQEREQYEYVVVEGKIVHQQTGNFLDTNGLPGAKWIFVMSTSKRLYAGEKKKGVFHHSTFLAGGATLAAGRLVVQNGILKDFAVEGQQHSGKKFHVMVTKLIQAEECTKFQSNHKWEKSSAPHAGCKSRRNSNMLTKDQKEARRYHRMLANRESARQTILRGQARCEELARKAAELECENEKLKKEKEVAMRKYESLKSKNEGLKAQLNLNRVTVNVEVKGTQEGSKFNNAYIPTSASTKTQQPHVYNQPSGLTYITAGSNIFQAAPPHGTVDTSKIPMITNSKTCLSEDGNPIRMNVPRSPYALPYTWLFPLSYYATGVPHQLSDLANKHIVTNESSTYSFWKTVADVKNDQRCPPKIIRGEASTSTKITGPLLQVYCEKASGKKSAHKHRVASAAVTNSSSPVIGLNARQTEAINRRNDVITSAAATSASAAENEAQTDGNLLRRQMHALTAAAARKWRKDVIKMKNFRYARQSHAKMS